LREPRKTSERNNTCISAPPDVKLDATRRAFANRVQIYNMFIQKDSKVLLQIGEATRSDSAAMKAVAVVTMAFLPATFTSVRSQTSMPEFQY
jgi:hypothetical protein